MGVPVSLDKHELEVIVRIDENTKLLRDDFKEHKADMEARMRAQEKYSHRQTGFMAALSVGASALFQYFFGSK